MHTPINKTIWRYYVFSFLRSCAFFSPVLIPFFTQWGGISLIQVQLLQSWYMLWIFLLEIPTGVVADYLGRKYSLILGSLVVACAAVLYGSIPRFEIFLIGEFLFGLGMALSSGADDALVYDTLKDAGVEHESKKVFGRAHSFGLFGIFVTALLGSQIAAAWGLNAAMYLSAIPFALAAVAAWSLPEPQKYSATSESKRYLTIIKMGFVYFRDHTILRLLALDAAVVACAAYFVIWFYQPLLMNLGVPVAYFGWFNALLIGSEIVVASNFTQLEKIAGSGRTYLKYAALITTLAFLLVALYPHLITVSLFIILAGGFGITRFELLTAYMNLHIPSDQRATILSSISMFRRFGLILLNPLVGFVASYSLRGALLGVGLLPILVFFFSPLKNKMFEKNE